jgi:hypothetical protein
MNAAVRQPNSCRHKTEITQVDTQVIADTVLGITAGGIVGGVVGMHAAVGQSHSCERKIQQPHMLIYRFQATLSGVPLWQLVLRIQLRSLY